MDSELIELTEQVAERKKRLELEKIKKELAEINFGSTHELTEFDSGMKQVDTYRVLKDKSKKQTIGDMVINTLISILNPRPVVRNLLGIALVLGCVFCLFNFIDMPELRKYKIYAAYILELAAFAQVLKSASRGLLIPLATAIFGLFAINTLGPHDQLFHHPRMFYEVMLIVGLLGISLTIFALD